jgi:CBS domain-containing protein
MAKKNPEFRRRNDELRRYADLRNSLVHWRGQTRDEYIAEPHEDILIRYEKLVESVKNPPKAIQIAVSQDKIYKVSRDASAADVIREMHRNVFTHVPVVDEKGLLVGIFSENSILSYLAHHKMAAIDPDTRIDEFKEFIPLGSHKSEVFDFVSRDTPLANVASSFQVNLKNKKRLGAVFVTENGRKEEKILGLITAWDVAGADLN